MILKRLLIAVFTGICLLSVATAQSSNKSQPSVAEKTKPVPVSAADFFGEIKNGVYSNRFFKFGFSVPGSFTILGRPELESYAKSGADIVGGVDGERSKIFDQAAQNTVNLFAASQKPAGSPDNSAIEITAIKQPATATDEQALAATLRVMTGTGKYTVTKNLSSMIGGRKMPGVEFETNAFGFPMKQRTFVTIQSGYSIMLTIVSSTDTGFVPFEEMLKTFRFHLN